MWYNNLSYTLTKDTEKVKQVLHSLSLMASGIYRRYEFRNVGKPEHPAV